ncbi:MAG: aggregation factor core [Pseudomonadota bacterium]
MQHKYLFSTLAIAAISVAGVGYSADTPAAGLSIKFTESAPKDRFTVTNTGTCALGPTELVIDLSQSSGGLYFDTTASGAGVEVFQPFEITEGAQNILSVQPVLDGDEKVSLTLKDLEPTQSVSFTIDVDDRLENSERGQIQVTGSEISGATVNLRQDGAQLQLTSFDSSSSAQLSLATCLS